MEMQGLSDDDLQAVVSYLRTQAPVRNPVPPHYYNLLGKVVKATALAHPVGPSTQPPARSPRGASVETGQYLVESVALCWACHTERSQMTGALTGPRFGGTKDFTESDDPAHSWSPPNITSDPAPIHLGCPTQPNGPIFDDQKSTYERSVVLIPTQPAGFGCPCHGGQYDTEGNRTAGPPVRALDRYNYSIKDGRLVLGSAYSVDYVKGEGKTARIKKYPLHMPGQHVAGPEFWLFPIPEIRA